MKVQQIQLKQDQKEEIKSFKSLKKELKSFFSIHGYSSILETDSIVKKTICLSCIIAFFATCMYYVCLNIQGFLAYDVVTQIKVKESDVILFPAITICAQDLVDRKTIIPKTIADLIECQFESSNCSLNDFEHIKIYQGQFDTDINCYKFNGGRNKTNHQIPLLSSKQFGQKSGLYVKFNLDNGPNQFIYYHVDDNYVRTIYTDLEHLVQPSRFAYVNIKKTINKQLPEPYGRCKEDISSETSHLVKKILEQNSTYRKAYCYNLCFNEYASFRNISKDVSVMHSFDFQGNCSKHCPLECTSNIFETSESIFEHKNSSKNFVHLNFKYSHNRYTEITQSIKTTEADFVSNTGGVLGLFLDFTFLSIYRFILNVLDFVFF